VSDPANNGKLKPIVFWPPFLLLMGAVVLNFINMDLFATVMNGVNNWLFLNFGWLFNSGSFATVLVCLFLMFSPFGKVKIGGSKAIPMFTPFKWWAMSLCCTIAIGLIFWSTCEPIFHLTAPPESWGIEPNSPEAATFAISTVFYHWGFTPYALFTVPALMFAFAYYNMKQPFSFGSTLYPIMGEKCKGVFGQVVDAICIFALIAGMASSLGVGILSITGGLGRMFGIEASPFIWLMVDLVIVLAFVGSAVTGITNGVKWLSDFNAKVFIGLLIFVIIVGPTAYSLNLGTEAFGNYIAKFMEKSFFTGVAAGDQWPQWWSIFYWAADIAWTPIMAVFLGQISYGYSVRAFMMVNFITPALFGILWMIIFGGGAIHMELVQNLGLAATIQNSGAEAGAFFFFGHLPLGQIFIPIFVFTMFLSFVTGSDAMTTAMGGMCSTGISPDSPEPKAWLKIIWGVILGAVAWVMMTFRGLDGIKMINTFGGFPALFLEIGITFALIKVALNPKKYDTFKEDYAADGTYIGTSGSLTVDAAAGTDSKVTMHQ